MHPQGFITQFNHCNIFPLINTLWNLLKFWWNVWKYRNYSMGFAHNDVTSSCFCKVMNFLVSKENIKMKFSSELSENFQKASFRELLRIPQIFVTKTERQTSRSLFINNTCFHITVETKVYNFQLCIIKYVIKQHSMVD